MAGLKRLLPRFSLRTLVIAPLLATCVFAVWWRWEPWVEVLTLETTCWQATFSPDGSTIATAGSDKVLKLFNSKTGELLRTLETHERGVSSFAFSTGGDFIATVRNDEEVRIWRTATGECVRSLDRINSGMYGAVFSPSGRHLATMHSDTFVTRSNYRVKLWDLTAGECVAVTPDTCAPVFSSDGKMMATNGPGKLVQVFEVRSGQRVTTIGLGMPARDVRFSEDGMRLLVFEDRLRRWDVRSGVCVDPGGPTKIYSHRVAVTPDGARHFAWRSGWATAVRETDTNRTLAHVEIKEPYDISFSPSGDCLVVVHAPAIAEPTPRIWQRRRPEWWWGVFYLWEFWLTAAFACLFIWSVITDRRPLARTG